MSPKTDAARDEAAIMSDCANVRARLEADELTPSKAHTLGELLSIELRALRVWKDQQRHEEVRGWIANSTGKSRGK